MRQEYLLAWARVIAVDGSGGINWDWLFFSNDVHANAFNQWCVAVGYETRGVYPPHNDRTWGVRYR